MRTGSGARILQLIKKVLIIGAGDTYSVLSRKSGLFCFYKIERCRYCIETAALMKKKGY